MRRILVAGLFALCWAWSFNVWAQSGPADRAQLQARFDALFARTLANPGDIDATFQFAEVATQLGEFEAAIGALERILFFNVQLPRIHLELGILYFRLGAYETSRQHLRTAISGTDVPEPVRKRVNEFLAEADRRLQRNQFSAQAKLGLRHQSNANVAPLGNIYRVFGFDFPLPDDAKRQPDWNFFFQGTARHVYDLHSQTGDSIETNAQLYQSLQFRLTRFDVGLIEVDSGPRFLLSNDGPRATVRPYAIVNYIELGHRSYLFTLGAGAALNMNFTADTAAEFRVEYRNRSFDNSKRNPEVAVQSGDLLQPTITLQTRLAPSLVGYARIGYGLNFADQAFYSFRQYQLDIGLNWDFDPPFLMLPAKATLAPFATLTATNYRAPNPTFDPDHKRHDLELRLGATLDVPVAERWGLFTQAYYSWADSNIPNFRSRNLAVSGGVSVRY